MAEKLPSLSAAAAVINNGILVGIFFGIVGFSCAEHFSAMTRRFSSVRNFSGALSPPRAIHHNRFPGDQGTRTIDCHPDWKSIHYKQ